MLYEEVLSLLKDEISNKEYDRYIKHLKYDEKSSKSNLAVFIASNPLIQKWITTKYSNLIAHYFEIKTGIKPQVIIQSGSYSHQSKNKVDEKKKNEDNRIKITLNPTYTFDSFIVGSSNQMAYALCESIAKKPASEYNPLFIYGQSGLGKTHMLQAIGNEALKNNQNIIYTTSEQFMNDFTSNLRNKTPDRFREKYRECDYLLIDDIQFLSQKEQTQEEFFHTFNELHSHSYP